jgi:hypothetical protein
VNSEPIILGLENELTVGVVSPDKRAQVPPLLAHLIEVLHKNVPSVRCTEMAGPLPGLMLGTNGSRIYADGLRLESATPEARTPEEVLAYQRANELLILRALSEAGSQCGLAEGDVRLSRIVTDYAPEPHFCGQHVNVLMRRYTLEELIESLLPFLISRYYAAAGGWGPTGFVMSHKAAAIRCVASPDTRELRGIVAINKNENLGPPHLKRMHLTHGDALMSELGTYLTVGCTALVCKMWDDGVCVGPAFALEDPLRALRQLDGDPTWARPLLRLKCGREVSGLDIQEHYLKAAEHYTRRGSREPWMQEVVKRWRRSLDALRKGPEHLADSLDPCIKSRLYGRILAKRGLSLGDFGLWCATLALMEPHLDGTPLPGRSVREHLRGRLPMVSYMLIEDRMARHCLQWDRLPEMRSLLQTGKTLDLRYHDIGEDGLYYRGRAQGIWDSKIITEEAIAQAMNTPPQGTRAWARGQAICQAWRDSSARANWMGVTSARGAMPLNDPFGCEGQWIAPAKPEPKQTA